MNPDILKRIETLNVGDLVEVNWLDASEGKTETLADTVFDIPVKTAGFFVGVYGKRMKHVIVLKEIFEGLDVHYNSIPVGMIETLEIHKRNALTPETIKALKPVIKKIKSRISRIQKTQALGGRIKYDGRGIK